MNRAETVVLCTQRILTEVEEGEMMRPGLKLCFLVSDCHPSRSESQRSAPVWQEGLELRLRQGPGVCLLLLHVWSRSEKHGGCGRSAIMRQEF